MILFSNVESAGPQSWTTWLYVIGAIVTLILVLWLINRLLKPKQFNAAVGNALMTAEVFFRPSREKIIDARRREDKEQDENGDPPTT